MAEGESVIKRLLAERGIRASWFAAKLGVSTWMFHHYEAHRKTPPDSYYERAAELLGVPADELRPDAEPEAAAV